MRFSLAFLFLVPCLLLLTTSVTPGRAATLGSGVRIESKPTNAIVNGVYPFKGLKNTTDKRAIIRLSSPMPLQIICDLIVSSTISSVSGEQWNACPQTKGIKRHGRWHYKIDLGRIYRHELYSLGLSLRAGDVWMNGKLNARDTIVWRSKR